MEKPNLASTWNYGIPTVQLTYTRWVNIYTKINYLKLITAQKERNQKTQSNYFSLKRMEHWFHMVMMKIQNTALRKQGQSMFSASKVLSQKILDFTRLMLKRPMSLQLTFKVRSNNCNCNKSWWLYWQLVRQFSQLIHTYPSSSLSACCGLHSKD